MRVLFFGTHPKQFNGYSKVVYELVKCNDIFKKHKIEFSVYGFQKFYENPAHRRDIPDSVEIYDAFSKEEPRVQGFGFTEVRKYVNEKKPDVCIVYNDMMVLHNVINQLKLAQNEDGLKFKIIAYIDQVYLNQKKEFIEFINKNADHGILFTPYWEKIILEQGLSIPTSYLQHGFNPMTYFPIPKKLARKYYNLKEEDFIILNLNRNQPRKRWDICMKAFAEIVSRHHTDKKVIKLLIATAIQGAWNLLELFERELKKRGLSLEQGMKHLIILDNPQQITDEETNILYNIADIGINTCDGEGFGLCNFEQAGMGIPQVLPNIGGFQDFFDENNCMLCQPKMSYYVDNSRDAVCGEALLCDYTDFVEGIESYYKDAELMQKHGQAARKRIVENYRWTDLTEKLSQTILSLFPKDSSEVKDLSDEVEKIDISTFNNVIQNKEDKEDKKEQLRRKLAEIQAKLAALDTDVEVIDLNTVD